MPGHWVRVPLCTATHLQSLAARALWPSWWLLATGESRTHQNGSDGEPGLHPCVQGVSTLTGGSGRDTSRVMEITLTCQRCGEEPGEWESIGTRSEVLGEQCMRELYAKRQSSSADVNFIDVLRRQLRQLDPAARAKIATELADDIRQELADIRVDAILELRGAHWSWRRIGDAMGLTKARVINIVGERRAARTRLRRWEPATGTTTQQWEDEDDWVGVP